MVKTCTSGMLAPCKSVMPQCWKEVLATSDLQDKAELHQDSTPIMKSPYGTTRYCCAKAKATVLCSRSVFVRIG